MKLSVVTPFSLILEVSNVTYIQAEDATGSFGILEGHADFITVLPASVIMWRDVDHQPHYLVVRSGVLSIQKGGCVEVAAREAVGEDSLGAIAQAIKSRFREEGAAEEESRVAAARLHLAAIRQLQRYLDAGRDSLFAAGQEASAANVPGRG